MFLTPENINQIISDFWQRPLWTVRMFSFHFLFVLCFILYIETNMIWFLFSIIAESNHNNNNDLGSGCVLKPISYIL